MARPPSFRYHSDVLDLVALPDVSTVTGSTDLPGARTTDEVLASSTRGDRQVAMRMLADRPKGFGRTFVDPHGRGSRTRAV